MYFNMMFLLALSFSIICGNAADIKCGKTQVIEKVESFNYTWTINGYKLSSNEGSHSVHKMQTGNITFDSKDFPGVWVFEIIHEDYYSGATYHRFTLKVTYSEEAIETYADKPFLKRMQITHEATAGDKHINLNSKMMDRYSRQNLGKKTDSLIYETQLNFGENQNIDELNIKYQMNLSTYNSVFTETLCT